MSRRNESLGVRSQESEVRSGRSEPGSHRRNAPILAIAVLLVLANSPGGATASSKAPVVAKWGRFEQSFKSSLTYSNPVQDAALTVLFTSPRGETNLVDGFWDGGKTWRVRFSPDQPG